MARPGRPERNRAARSFRQLMRFHHVINSDKVFGTHRQNSMSKLLADAETVQAAPPVQSAPWTNRWVDIEPSPIVSRWVDIAQVAPPPIIKREPEPLVTPRGLVMVMVIITIILTLYLNGIGGLTSLFRVTSLFRLAVCRSKYL